MRILFVCTGNSCRSPMAELYFDDLCRRAGRRDFLVGSAGTSTGDGGVISRGAAGVMRALNIDSSRFPIVPADALDMIVVPLVAFDRTGARLGYGGGCYDRYLPTLSTSCHIIGIAFEEQRVDRVPADAHDLPGYPRAGAIVDCGDYVLVNLQ